jgi:hypothetical protein
VPVRITGAVTCIARLEIAPRPSKNARPRAHGADLGCPSPIDRLLADSSDEAVNNVGGLSELSGKSSTRATSWIVRDRTAKAARVNL